MRWVVSCVMGHAMGGVMRVKGHHMAGSCVRGSLHGWGHAWGHASYNGATHSGKGSICSKLFARQGFCGWLGRVNLRCQMMEASLIQLKRKSQTLPFFSKSLHFYGRPIFIQCRYWEEVRSLHKLSRPQPSTG